MYYDEEQVRNVLDLCGLRVQSTTSRTFITYCPFHGGHNTPSFNVARDGAGYNCHNPACGKHGSLLNLVMSVTGKNQFAAKRVIGSQEFILKNIDERIEKTLAPVEFPTPPQGLIARLHSELWTSPKALDYMHGRQFTDKTLERFEIGYSAKTDMITVPMHDIKGSEVGFIGRSIDTKNFSNTAHLPKGYTLYNIHRAVRTGAEAVNIVESSFDCHTLDQFGFANTVATLGSGFSEYHAQQIRRYFKKVILFVDGDPEGQAFGENIIDMLPTTQVLWAHSKEATRFPGDKKDVNMCTEQEIREMNANAMYPFELGVV